MSLTSLLGLRPSVGGLSLAAYMRALERGEITPPVERDGLQGMVPQAPARPAPPKPDPVDAALAQQRQEQQLQDAQDREQMLTHIRARRVGTYRNPQPGELERQHKINKRMTAAEAALNGGYVDE